MDLKFRIHVPTALRKGNSRLCPWSADITAQVAYLDVFNPHPFISFLLGVLDLSQFCGHVKDMYTLRL
jgi:hypothetical protein